MDKEIEAFRADVVSWRGGKGLGTRRYPGAMKAKAVQLATGLRKQGLTMKASAQRLGMAVSMLYAWKKPAKRVGMVPVKIVPASIAERPALSTSTVRLLSPRGYRVEVSSATMAVALLRELG